MRYLVCEANKGTSLNTEESVKSNYDPNECQKFLSNIEPRMPKDLILLYSSKLQTYCPIEELHELRTGQYIKWIPKENTSIIKPGGVYIGVKFCNTGTLLTVRMIFGRERRYRIFHLKFDNYYIFQKIRKEDIFINMIR